MRFEHDVLLRVFAFNEILVVKVKAELTSRKSLTKHINTLLFGKILEAAGNCNCIDYCRTDREGIGSRSSHFTEDIEFKAMNFLDNDNDLRVSYVAFEAVGNILLELRGGAASRLDIADERQGDFSIGSYGDLLSQVRLFPDIDRQDIVIPNDESIVGAGGSSGRTGLIRRFGRRSTRNPSYRG